MNMFTPLRKSLTAAAAVLVAAAAATSLAPPSAHAAAVGTYVHRSCLDPTDIADAYGGWQYPGSAATGLTFTNQCPWGGLHMEMFPSSTVPAGTYIGQDYTAPPGTKVTRVSMELAGWVGTTSTSKMLLVDASGSALDSFQGSADPSHKTTLNAAAINASQVGIRLVCATASGCSGNTGWASFYFPRLWLADDTPPVVTSAAGTLTTDPSLKGDETVAYKATDTGGGIARLRVYVDGALSSVDHTIDTNNGHCVANWTDADGTWSFNAPKPCPGAVDAVETIDTTQFPDGAHLITIKVVDAAQREATVWTGSRTVANNPPALGTAPSYDAPAVAAKPIAGTELVVTAGTWTGPSITFAYAWQRCDSQGGNCAQIPGASTLRYVPTGEDIGHRLRLAITATNPADSVTTYTNPTGIVVQPSSAGETTVKPPTTGADGANGANGANGSSGNVGAAPPALTSSTTTSEIQHIFVGRVTGEREGVACPNDRATLKFQHISGGQLKIGFGKTSTVQTELTCTDTGRAIAGAKLEIATQVGARAAVASDMTTDGAGHALLRIGKGPSRGVTVGYRMYADDPTARALGTFKVLVNGRLTIKANHKHVRNGQAVTLTGSLAGGEVPRRGVNLAVQWKDGKKWRPFAQIKTSRKGAYRYAYKFTRTGKPVRYQLRVQVTKGQVDYPYQPVASKLVAVTVAP